MTEASASVIWNRRKSPKSTVMDRVFLRDVEQKPGELNWTATLVEYEQHFKPTKTW